MAQKKLHEHYEHGINKASEMILATTVFKLINKIKQKIYSDQNKDKS